MFYLLSFFEPISHSGFWLLPFSLLSICQTPWVWLFLIPQCHQYSSNITCSIVSQLLHISAKSEQHCSFGWGSGGWRQRQAKRREASKRYRDDKRREVKVKGNKAARRGRLSLPFPSELSIPWSLGKQERGMRDGIEGGKRMDQIIRQGVEGSQQGTVHRRAEEETVMLQKLSDLSWLPLICTSTSHVKQDFKNLI